MRSCSKRTFRWPGNGIDLNALIKQVLDNPFYRNVLISEDGSLTTLIIETSAIVESQQDTNDILDGFDDTFTDENEPGIKHENRSYFSEKENSRSKNRYRHP